MIFLASAEPTDLSGSDWLVILIGLCVVAVAAALAIIPIGAARHRGHHRAETITAAAILWGLVAAGSVIRFSMAKLQWSHEYLERIKTGYYDPTDLSGAPTWPWMLWGILALTYCAILGWALSWKKPPSAPP